MLMYSIVTIPTLSFANDREAPPPSWSNHLSINTIPSYTSLKPGSVRILAVTSSSINYILQYVLNEKKLTMITKSFSRSSIKPNNKANQQPIASSELWRTRVDLSLTLLSSKLTNSKSSAESSQTRSSILQLHEIIQLLLVRCRLPQHG